MLVPEATPDGRLGLRAGADAEALALTTATENQQAMCGRR